MRNLLAGVGGGLRKLRGFLRGRRVLSSVLIFIVGVGIGFALKLWAEQTVIIGFEDYLIDTNTEYMDLNAAAVRAR